MVNKFEAIGIMASISIMAVALFLLNTDTEVVLEEAEQSAAVVVAGERTDADVEAALVQAVTRTGDVVKLVIDDVQFGTGDAVEVGDTVVVHYIGTLQNGQQFDNSYLKGAPFEFTLGEKKVIAGWEEGLIGMKTGGQRILVIPPEKGYGKNGIGPIPGDATLVFSIELLEIK